MATSGNAARPFGRRGVAGPRPRGPGRIGASPGRGGGEAPGLDPALLRTLLGGGEGTVARLDADLILAFIGPNREAYEPTVVRMAAAASDFSTLVAGWCWPAFLAPVAWLALRGMRWGAFAAAGVTAALPLLLPSLPWSAMVASLGFALVAKSLYVRDAARKVSALAAVEPDRHEAIRAIAALGASARSGGLWLALSLQALPWMLMATTIAGSLGGSDGASLAALLTID